MKERRVWHLLMQIPTVTGCISLFQFCSETSVENKSASFFCCSVQASLLLYVCKYNQPACIKAARQEEFPLKKRDSPWISASEQKWLPCITHMGPSLPESFANSGCTAFCGATVPSPVFFFHCSTHTALYHYSERWLFSIILTQVLYFH